VVSRDYIFNPITDPVFYFRHEGRIAMISFNLPPYGEKSVQYMQEAIQSGKISGDGAFTKACSLWIEKNTLVSRALLTTSGTHALEMAAILCDVKPNDEVIMPSFTFTSTANAFVLRGAKIVFIDIRPDTMNMDEALIEEAITEKTKIIAPVHYAGVACEMDTVMKLAKQYNLKVVEDAAQGVMSKYKGQALGSIGDYGCFSFHETKNYCMGEGGALLIKDAADADRAEIIREKGTNRSRFFRGQVDKYSWVDEGSSYLPSELNAAYLLAQLEIADEINNKRMALWNQYYMGLKALQNNELLSLPIIPEHCLQNGHMFYVKAKNLEQRTALIDYLKKKGILSVFHYVPLHSTVAGLKFGRFSGKDRYTTQESDKLLRLPMYYSLTHEQADYIIEAVKSFYE
jgi:dTDP-4-amino-4,6-dideoxygalactose transaminase